MKNNQTGFITPLVMVIILLLMGGGYYYFTTANKSAILSPVSKTASKEDVSGDFSAETKSRNKSYQSNFRTRKEKMTVGNDAKIKHLLLSLRTSSDLFYDSSSESYKGFCQSSEVISANNEILKIQGRGLQCFDTESSYSVSAPLTFNPEYFCIDSNGSMIITSIKTVTTFCAK